VIVSEALLGALIGAGAALAGSALTFYLESRRRARERDADAADALRSQRATAYRAFILEVHRAAHHMAQATNLPATDATSARGDATARVNRDVVATLLELEVVAEPDTLATARELRDILREFRTLVETGVATQTDAWNEVLGRYRETRQRFVMLARREVIPLHADRTA
jgi:hypothetical protein